MNLKEFLLETFIVTEDNPIFENAPEEAKDIYYRDSQDGYPTALSYFDGRWYVITSSGQGPSIIWSEE